MILPSNLDPQLAQSLQAWVELAERVLPLYIESARHYAQLSVGALAVSIAFQEKVLGQQGRIRASMMLFGAWICLLLSIGAGAWYQYVAIKEIAWIVEGVTRGMSPYDVPLQFPLTIGWLWPGYTYGMMVVTFFLGAVLLVAACVQQILTKSSKSVVV